MRLASALVLMALWASGARAVELQPETVQAFDRYIRTTEEHLDRRLRPGGKFLWTDEDAQRASQVRGGQLVIENRARAGPLSVPGGLIHDWIGAVFIPRVTLAQTLALVQDFNHNGAYYQPEVVASRLVSRNGDDFKINLRLMKKKIITVVLETDYDVHYTSLDGLRSVSRAYSTRIAEVQNPGGREEHTLPPGNDHGFLWRLYSYWSYQQRDGGVYMECEAISLTRAVPAGLGWLIGPIVQNLPRESFENTLRKTRAAMGKFQSAALVLTQPQ